MKLAPLLVLVIGCESAPTELDLHTPEARAQYPTLTALYSGDQGIYRGCGPNNGVCHSANESPDLDSVGSILDNLDRPCNQKRETAAAVDDLCERAGDRLQIAGDAIEIAWVVPVPAEDGTVRRWRLALRDAPSTEGAGEELAILRGEQELWHLARYATPSFDRGDRKVLLLEALPATADGDPAATLALALASAGIPSLPEAVRVGDPNRNGTFGAALGGRLIKPGDPKRSYLLHRLTDPAAGPLMPRANCCGWSLAAVRALWCWVDGLREDGRNAMAPIDYDACSSSPDVHLLYPELGPGCQTAGSCPVRVDLDDAARFPALYANVLSVRCAGDTCHDRGEVAGVDLSTEERAFTTLRTKVVSGDPEASILYRRLSPAFCSGDCTPMPLGRPLLPEDERELVRAWIAAGTPSE